MSTNRTFTMIKPDAVANGHIGSIINDITNAGFKIIALKYCNQLGGTKQSASVVTIHEPIDFSTAISMAFFLYELVD